MDCQHKFFTMSDDTAHCIYCMEDYDDYQFDICMQHEVSSKIKIIRNKLGLSQQKFANLMGIDSARTVRFYESLTRRIPAWVIKKIMEYDTSNENNTNT